MKLRLIERFRAAWLAFCRPEVTTEYRVPVTVGKVTALVGPGCTEIELRAYGASGAGGSGLVEKHPRTQHIAPQEEDGQRLDVALFGFPLF